MKITVTTPPRVVVIEMSEEEAVAVRDVLGSARGADADRTYHIFDELDEVVKKF